MTDSPYAALHIHNYRLYVAARLLATLAIQMQVVAVGWQIYALTKDPLSLGLIGLSEALPALAISLYAGHITDIVDRKMVAGGAVLTMAFCMSALSGCSAIIPDHKLLVIIIYCIIALIGLARGFYAPPIFSILADIVPRNLYGNAIAWNTTIWQASAVIGPCLAGFLYVCFGASKTYFVATLCLISSFVFFVLLKAKSDHTVKISGGALKNIKQGLRFVFRNEIVLGAMTLDLFGVLFGGATALLPMFTSEVFHYGPQALGILRAAPPVGALLTATILTHKPIADNAGAILLTVVAGFGLCMICFGLSTNFYLSLFLLALSGSLDGVSVWLRNTIIQLVTPNTMKGRVAAVNSMFIQSSNEIGGFESGVTAKLMGLVPSVVFGGCATLLVVLTTSIKNPKLRNLHLHTLFNKHQEFEKQT